MINGLKKKIRARQFSMGSWIGIPDVLTTEIMSQAGFEWLVIDMEHAPIGIAEASKLIRIIDLAGLPSMCRVPENDPVIIKNVLDSGADGIIVPMIESREEALRIIDAVYYPPKGKRGVGLHRAQQYGSGFEEYKSKTINEIVVIAMIESKKGIDNIESISAVDGIDAFLVGPYDLSSSMGLIGQLDHKDIRSSLKKVIQTAKSNGKGCGMHIVHPSEERIKWAFDDGYTFLAIGVDFIYLASAARESVNFYNKIYLNNKK